MAKNRNLGIDILCCLGVILLLGVQYMNAVGSMEQPISSYYAAMPVAVRFFCLSGAMLLSAGTGYVLCGKKFSTGYFRIFLRLIYVYLICSLAALGMRALFLQEDMAFGEAVQSLLQFTATETGRFAGMYFGLLLAAPFLNAAIYGLKTQKACRIFVILTAAVSTLQPMLLISGMYLIPEWCKGLFPIAAYLGGAYMKRYQKKKQAPLCVLAVILLIAVQTAVVLLVRLPSGGMPSVPQLDSMASLPCYLIALCLLRLFHSKKNGSGSVHRFFAGAAGGALAALLLGDPLIDCMLPMIDERFPGMDLQLWAGFGIVPVLFIICCVCGLLLQLPLFGVRSLFQSEEAEEEEEEEKPRRKKKEDVVVPRRILTQPARNRAENDPRHTILVPVSQPERSVKLTQPADEDPPGVHEVAAADPPEDVLPEAAYVPEDPPRPEETVSGDTAKLYIPKKDRKQPQKPLTVEDILGIEKKQPKPDPPKDTATSINDLLNKLSK